MTCKLLFFDYRKSEEKFFSRNNFENFDIKFYRHSLNKDTVKNLPQELLDKTTIVSVFITSEIDKDVISKFKNLRVISTRSTGYDHICVNSCTDRNITLINVENYGRLPVSQFTIGLIIMLTRNILPSIAKVPDNTFSVENFIGSDLNSLTLGIIGTGSIGSAVAQYAKCLGMKVLAYDKNCNAELEKNEFVKCVEMEELLTRSDIVSLHLPYTQGNTKMFSYTQFDMMKNNSYFINVSRGELVDNNALLKALDNGKLKGVGLDVVSCTEASSEWEKIEKSSIYCVDKSKIIKRLLQHPNVIITPHIAYNTQEAIDYILKTTFEGISDYLSGGFKHRVV
mgnify:FL=1